MPAPVFLLAFAYDPNDLLPEVAKELRTIQRLLTETGGNAEPIWQVTRQDLERAFDTQRDHLRLFHYSGHAGPNGLHLNQDGQPSRISFAGGLARLAGLAPDLRLVFLNGCSTADQAKAFFARGVPAVIATTRPLVDRYAVEFARCFYDNFTRRGGRNTLQQAFDIALDSFLETYDLTDPALFDARLRGNLDQEDDPTRPLYELHLHADKPEMAHERFAEWFEAPAREPGAPPNSATPGSSAPLRERIQSLVGQGDLEDALTELVKVVPDAILLKGQYASAKRENGLGLLDSDDWRRTVARLNNAVLEMARML